MSYKINKYLALIPNGADKLIILRPWQKKIKRDEMGRNNINNNNNILDTWWKNLNPLII